MAQVAHVTRDSDTTFKVKMSKVEVTRPVYRGVYTHAAAAVSVGTYWAWETAAIIIIIIVVVVVVVVSK